MSYLKLAFLFVSISLLLTACANEARKQNKEIPRVPSPQSIEIRKRLQKEKIRNDSIQTQRKEWADYAKTLALAKGTKLQEETLGGVPCLWVHNEESKEDRVILYLHGGGLVDGSTLTHREMASRFSQITHLPVVLVDYRLLPEHPYPAPLEDVLSAYRALINQKKIEPKQIIFGGDSSGGGLVVATMMRLRDSNEPLPHRAFTISGVFDVSLSGDTPHTLDKADPILSHAVLKDWQAKYFSNSVELKSPFLSPLFGNLANLPPLLIQVGSDEVWLSDSIRLATKIKEAGGSIHLKVWDSMWHVWHMNAELPEAKWAIEEIRDFIFDEQIVENRQ